MLTRFRTVWWFALVAVLSLPACRDTSTGPTPTQIEVTEAALGLLARDCRGGPAAAESREAYEAFRRGELLIDERPRLHVVLSRVEEDGTTRLLVSWLAMRFDVESVRLRCEHGESDVPLTEFQRQLMMSEEQAGSMLFSASYVFPPSDPIGDILQECIEGAETMTVELLKAGDVLAGQKIVLVSESR